MILVKISLCCIRKTDQYESKEGLLLFRFQKVKSYKKLLTINYLASN